MKETNGVQLVIRITSIAAAVCAIVASVLLKQSQRTAGIGTLMLISSVIVLILLAVEYFFFAGSTRKYIAKSAALLNKTEKESLLNFPAPAVIIDQDNCIVWYNKLFGKTVVKGVEPYGITITDLFEIDMNAIFGREGDRICKDGKFYNVRAIHTDHGADMAMLYFADTTELVELDYENRQSHQSVIIIMIDYYEELISNIRESEKAHLLVSIEQLIENFIDGTTGISRRAGNDRFYVILEERYLQPIIEKRFEILEKARKIRVSDRTGITLSIGVGHDAENLAESEKYAKKALDMCLGRGGDQAAVRTADGYEFYGGQSKGMSKNTRVKSRMVANALVEIIGSYDRVLVMGHQWGDLDSIGSAVGICDAIKSLGRESYVVVDREKNLAATIIEHIEQNTIKNYFISPKEALAKLDDSTLLIVTDTHNPAIVDSKELLEHSLHRVVIDHHRLIISPIDDTELFYHEPSASSACEMVAELLEYFPDISLSTPIAEGLLSGIMLDTKNFIMNTGVRTFEAAAFLKRQGADTVSVKRLFSNSLDTYRGKAAIIDSTEIYRKCAIAISDQTFDNIRVASSKAADEMLEITGVNASFVIYKMGDQVYISARSLGSYNVQLIMETLGGGGHHTMAACQLNCTLKDARRQLCNAIDEYIRNN